MTAMAEQQPVASGNPSFHQRGIDLNEGKCK
jgi:hypothetical protein